MTAKINTITARLGEIVSAPAALVALSDCDLDVGLSFQLIKIARAVDEQVDIFNRLVAGLRTRHLNGRSYSELKEAEKVKADEAFQADLQDALGQVVEIPLPKIKLSRLLAQERVRIAPANLATLSFIFEEDVQLSAPPELPGATKE